MDATISKETLFAEKIKEQLKQESSHRYEIQDPFADTKYRLFTSTEAIKKAEELNFTAFQAVDSERRVTQISKVNDTWQTADGKPLSDLQAQNDMNSTTAIYTRAEQRVALASEGVSTAKADKDIALADAYDFRRLENANYKQGAAAVIANNMQQSQDYKAGIETAFTGYLENPPKPSKIALVVADLTKTIPVVDPVKEIDVSQFRNNEQTAQTVVESAKVIDLSQFQKTAQPGITEPAIVDPVKEVDVSQFRKTEQAGPTVVDPVKEVNLGDLQADLQKVEQNRQRDFLAVSQQLGLNSIALDVVKERQQLDSENESKRNEWLKKLDQPEQVAVQPKQRGDNIVQSDEVFNDVQDDVKPAIPDDIEKRYLRVGEKFYHPKNRDIVAFEDKGNKLETQSNSEYIAESLVRIAEARGWDEIKVSGSDTFRREVWIEAASRGMHIRGYTPTEQDKAVVDKRVSESEANKIEPENQTSSRQHETQQNAEHKQSPNGNIPVHSDDFRVRENNSDVNSGKPVDKSVTLIDHGADNYQHVKENTESYFISMKDNQGNEKKIWGIDLERAITESGAAIGDKIAVTNEGRQAVKVNEPVRNETGEIVGYEDKEAHRNKWNVEVLTSTLKSNDPITAAKQHPELVGAAAISVAIDKQAQADGLNPEQRKIVAERVTQNLVNSIEAGNIPTANLNQERTLVINKERDLER